MTTVTAAPSSAAASPSTGASALAGITGDFSLFLKMLTTQMQNQDPLNPMDTAQYTQQLVQFSQVEQSIKQSGTLKDILSSLSTQSMAQASGLIGRTGEFDTAVAGLAADAPASWSVTLPAAATAVTAVVSDAGGRAVHTEALSAAQVADRYRWNGTLADGRRAPDGAYTLVLTATDAAGGFVSPTVRSVGRIGEVIAGNGKVSLGVNGVPLALATLLRVTD